MTPRQTSINLTPATEKQIEDLKAAGFGGFTDIVRLAIDRMHRRETSNSGKVLDFYPIEPPEWDTVKDLHPTQLYHLEQAIKLRELEIMTTRLNQAGFATQTTHGDSRFSLILVYAPDDTQLNTWATASEAQRLLDTARNLPPAEAYARWLPKVIPLAHEPYSEDITRQDAHEARERLRQRYQAGEIDAETFRLGWQATRP